MKKKTETPSNIRLPHVKPDDLEITPKERLIYLYIKKHRNNETGRCDPSLTKLKNDSGLSIPTLRKCIAALENKGYFKIIKKAKGQQYVFDTDKNYEQISKNLLENKDINFTEKSLITSSVQFMLDKGETGKIGYTNKELSEIINMPESTISKCIRDLTNRGYVISVKSNSIDKETGCKKEIKLFDLVKLGQDVIYKIKEHDNTLIEHSEQISDLESQIKKLTAKGIEYENTNKLLLKKITELEEKLKNKEDLIL